MDRFTTNRLIAIGAIIAVLAFVPVYLVFTAWCGALAREQWAIGEARANEIISKSISPELTRYLYIQNIERARTIYVPTEAGLPVLEAGEKQRPK